MANYNLSGSYNGLRTYSFGVPEAGSYFIAGKISFPRQSESSPFPSQVVVTVNVNGGAAIYTGAAGADGFGTSATMSAGDVFNVIFSSSLASDQALDAIKYTITIVEA